MRNVCDIAPMAADRSRKLRRYATDAEAMLWQALGERLPQAGWRREVPFGPYYVDFLTFPSRLVVEVDGGQHANGGEYDRARTLYLERRGYRVLRFWNGEVIEDLDAVIAMIASHLPTQIPLDIEADKAPPAPARRGRKKAPLPRKRAVESLDIASGTEEG